MIMVLNKKNNDELMITFSMTTVEIITGNIFLIRTVKIKTNIVSVYLKTDIGKVNAKVNFVLL